MNKSKQQTNNKNQSLTKTKLNMKKSNIKFSIS
jgi:hypothetical protein